MIDLYVISRKKISVILCSILLGVFAYSYQLSKMNININGDIVQTTATPVSGKVVVVDARTSENQMKERKVLQEQQKQRQI